MTFEEMQVMWGEDSKIDLARLDQHSAESHHLMSKYMNIRSQERLMLAALESEGVKLRWLRRQWLLGEVPIEKLRELGWDKNPIKVIKMEVNDYLEADDLLTKHTMKIAVSKEKVSFLEDVVKALSFRSTAIRNIIDNKRFEAGDHHR